MISKAFSQSLSVQKLGKLISKSFDSSNKNIIHIKDLLGSSLSFTIASVFEQAERPFVVILNDKEEAAYYLNDLEQLIDKDRVLFILVAIVVHTK